MRSQYALPARVAKRVNEEARDLAVAAAANREEGSQAANQNSNFNVPSDNVDEDDVNSLIHGIITRHDSPHGPNNAIAVSSNSRTGVRGAPHVAAAVREMLAASPHDDALTNVGHRPQESWRSSLSLALIEDFDLDALLADESSLLQAQLEEEEEYGEGDEEYYDDGNGFSVQPISEEPPHKQPPPPPTPLPPIVAPAPQPPQPLEPPQPPQPPPFYSTDADDLSSIPLPPTPLSADDERVARASVVIAPEEPPDDSGRPSSSSTVVVDLEPHDTPPRASTTMSIDSDFDVTGSSSTTQPPQPTPPPFTQPQRDAPPLLTAPTPELPPPPVPPDAESVRAPPEPASSRVEDGRQGVLEFDIDRQAAAAAASRVQHAVQKPPVPTSAPPSKLLPPLRSVGPAPVTKPTTKPTVPPTAAAAAAAVAAAAPAAKDKSADRARSPSRKNNAAKKAKSPTRRPKKERALCDNCKERKASHRATLVTGQVIKLCATCTERARDAKRAAEQKQAAAAASAAASAASAAAASGPASPALRKRERGMRYLEKVFPTHDRTVLSSTLEQHSLDFVAAGESLQRQQQGGQATPSQPPAVPFYIQPPPNATAGVPPPVPPPVPPWAEAPPMPLPLPPTAPPRRVVPNRERRATLREQFLLDAQSDNDGDGHLGDEDGRVAQLRSRLAEEQRVRADARQLRDALVAKLERVKAQRNKLRDKLDSVARQVRWMQEDGAVPPRDIERVKDQKRMLVRKLLELDEKHNKYIGMLRRVDADRARNDAVRAALQNEIAQLTDELERRAAEAERDATRQPANRRDSLHNAVRQLRALSTLKVDKDGLVVVPSAPVAGAPLPPPRRGPLPAPPQQRATPPISVAASSPALPVAARAPSPLGGAVSAARLPLVRGGMRAPASNPGSAHVASNVDEQVERDSRRRSNSDVETTAATSTATNVAFASLPRAGAAQQSALAMSAPLVPPPSLSPPPSLPPTPVQQPQPLPGAARRLAFPTMPALASPFRVHTRPVGGGGALSNSSTQPLPVPPANANAAPPPAVSAGSPVNTPTSPTTSPKTRRKEPAIMPRQVALKRLEELDDEMARLRKDGDAMAALADFYAKDPNGRAKVERERAKVARTLAALRDERTTVLAALGPEVEQRDLAVATQQLQEVEAVIAVRTKAHSGLSMLVSMYANDTARAQGRQNAEDELADITVELDRLEQRRDALQKLIADIEQSGGGKAKPVAVAASSSLAASATATSSPIKSKSPTTATAAPIARESPWRLCVTEDNEEYYFNPSTDETSWELPEGVNRSELRAWEPDEERPSSRKSSTGGASNEDDADGDANDASLSEQLQAVESAHRNSGEVLRTAGEWTAYWSRTEQAPYYFNAETNQTTWECPPALQNQ